MRTTALIPLLLLAACAADTAGGNGSNAAPRAGAAEILPGRPVLLTGQSLWQVYYLPKFWREEHLADSDVELAYVLVAAPHRIDLDAAYSPCAPPARIVLGVVGASTPPREHLARCLQTCGDQGGAPGGHRDLWEAYTQLEGTTLQILDQGSIDVIQHYRERLFVPPEVAEDPLVVEKVRLGEEVRIRHDVIESDEFRFSGHEAGPCTTEPR